MSQQRLSYLPAMSAGARVDVRIDVAWPRRLRSTNASTAAIGMIDVFRTAAVN